MSNLTAETIDVGERWTIGLYYSSSVGNSEIGASQIALGCIWPHISSVPAAGNDNPTDSQLIMSRV